ncbi:MAG: hypothetical protein ABI863_11710 [Ginsengibacter sp.]
MAALEAQSRVEEPSVDFEKAVTKIINTKSKNGRVSAKNKNVG